MKTVQMQDRVRVEGHEDVYRVVQVDAERGWADLACVGQVGYLIHVPLERIRPADKKRTSS